MTAEHDRIPTASRREYERRINAVHDHITGHLDARLDLETLAAVACFSPFHFHRIFTALTGETLGACVKRLRLEAAANALTHNPDTSVLGVALDCGFSSHAVFSREFRQRFGETPSAWRRRTRDELRKHGQADRKDGQAAPPAGAHPGFVFPEPEPRSPSMDVTIKDLPRQRVAYLRATGRYGTMEQELWERMCRWAGPRGLLRPGEPTVSICHDSPEVTPPDRCRYDACVPLPDGFEPDGGVNTAVLPGGRYAVYRVDGTVADFGPAWTDIFARWLPGSGWQCDERPCLERCYGEPEPGTGRLVFDVCIPVKPL